MRQVRLLYDKKWPGGSQGISSLARAPGDLRPYSDSIFHALSFKTNPIALSLKLKKLEQNLKKISKILNF